ncbi:MAG: hypothetical protein U0Z44_13420 [Kouleothrix sp.]
MFTIVTLGDLVADITAAVPALPLEPGHYQEAHAVRLEPGGAGNFLIAARAWACAWSRPARSATTRLAAMSRRPWRPRASTWRWSSTRPARRPPWCW